MFRKLRFGRRETEGTVGAGTNSVEEHERLALVLGRVLAHRSCDVEIVTDLRAVEFKIFSQWGDDGIIQYLISRIPGVIDTFIEFGCGDYRESNTRFLLLNDNWRGLVMDSSSQNISAIQSDWYYWRHDLTAKEAMVTAENVNAIIADAGITGDIGILHIDVDGNDYWIWKAVSVVEPQIVIVEYNSLFGSDRAITIPYDPKFERFGAHSSGLYAGTSLLALCDLAKEKGYEFVGSNSAGNNAYFVRRDALGELPVVTGEDGYVQCRFREHRDSSGNLTFQRGKDAVEVLRGLKVFNTREQRLEAF